MRPRNDVAFLCEHGDNVVQVLLAGQGQGSDARGELGVVYRVVKDGLREGTHVHLVAFFLVQAVQQALHHPGLVSVNSHQQSLVDLPEVKLDPLQQGVHGVLSAQADGQVEGFPPLAIFRLIQLPDDAVAGFQEPVQLLDFALLNSADKLRREAHLLVHDLAPLIWLRSRTAFGVRVWLTLKKEKESDI